MFLAAALLILHNATVIDNGVHRNVDVTIEGERIVSVLPHADHKTAEVIDLTGKYIVPGFIDMHAHVLWHPVNGRLDMEVTRGFLRLLVEHGVTTVRDPGSETETAVTLKRMTSAPRIYTAGRIINSSSFNPEPFLPIKNADDIRREIRWQKAAGVDFIKIYSSMTPELVKVAIDEAHANGLPVIGHLQRTTWTEAAKLGIDAIAHGASWSPEYLPEHKRAAYQQTMFGRVYWLNNIDLKSQVFRELADALNAGNVSLDPTLIAYHTKFFGDDARWLESPDNQLVPPAVREHWKSTAFTRDWSAEQFAAGHAAWPKMLALTKFLHDRGVLLTVGTDMPTPWIVPGASFHSEMELLVSAGISPVDVLKMATRNAAAALPAGNGVGGAAAGCYADLVVLARNPLEDIRNTRSIEMVFARGVILSREDSEGSSAKYP